MNDDARLAQMLDRLGDVPTPEFRETLRERLVDEATGRTIVPIEVEPPDAHRRDSQPGWLVAGAVAAAVALVVAGLVVVNRRPDPSPADRPAVFAALTAIAHQRLLEVQVTTTQIVADPGVDLVASLRIETADAATGVVELSGDDTCTRYSGTITVDEHGRVTGTELESPAEACDDNSIMPTAGDVLRPIDGGIEIVAGDEVHRFVSFEALEHYDPAGSGWDGSYAAAAAERSRLLEIAPGPAIAFGPCVAAVELGDDGFLSAREDVTCSTDGVYGLLLDALLGGSLRIARYGGFLYADTTELTVLLRPAGGISDEFRPPTPDDLTGHLWIDPDLGLVRVPMLSFAATEADGVYTFEQFDGCNHGSGTVTLDGGDVVTAEGDSTVVACAFDQPAGFGTGGVVGVDIDNLGRLRLLVSNGGATTSYVALDSLPAARTAAEMRNTWWNPGTGAITFTPTGRLSDSGGLAVAIGQCDTSGTIADGYLTTSEPIEATCVVVPEADPDLIGRLADGNSRWYRYDTLLLMESERGVDLFDVYSTLVTPPGDATPGTAVAAFTDAVAGRTFVLLPDGDDTAIDRPYITFQDPSDPELAFEGWTGCMGFFGKGTWEPRDGGAVAFHGLATYSPPGCDLPSGGIGGDGTFELVSNKIETTFEVAGDALLITTGSTRRLVAIDALPIPSLEQLGGRWSAGEEGELTVDWPQSQLLAGGCRTTVTMLGSADLGTDGWRGTDCLGTELSLMRALQTSETQQSVNKVHLADDVLLIDSGSAKRRLIVFALPYAGPLLDPTTVSIELGSAFGYRPNDEVTADEIEAHVSSLLGPTTHDTGWFVTPIDPTITDSEDCMGGRTTRVLWWHDLSLAMWRPADGAERLFAWSIGDIRATRSGDRREPYVAAVTDRSDITTEGRFPIGVGTAAGDVIDAYPDVIQSTGPAFDDGARTWQIGPVTFVVRDDTVVGVGNEISFC
jgi:hypothetical protein